MFRSKKPKTVPRVPGVQKSWVFLSPRVTGFSDNESGTLTIFAVYIFILMLMIGGMGVDLMRIERDRALLQSTLDRAVLAAADLDQELDPEAVVNDYFDKAGLSDYLTNVDPQEGLNYRIVSAEAISTIDTQFM
ncbi:MAG: Tad domain-containing protein, partial [Pseudomonadota bacterium]